MSSEHPLRRHPGRIFIPLVLVAALMAAFLATRGTETSVAASGDPTSVVLIIGDGMGPAQREATQLNRHGYTDTQPMDDLEHAGLIRTHSLQPITDSAAGATALATGQKTKNNMAGVDPEGNDLETLLDSAKDLGKATGMISDHDITNATLASFGAHVKDRDQKKRIAYQYAYQSQPDVMFGGGEKTWYRPQDQDKIPDIYDDDANNASENLVQKLIDDGYEYAYDRETVNDLSGPKALGLVQDSPYLIGHDFKDYNRRNDPHFVPQEKLVQKALEILDQNPNGFFLVIEQDALDDAGHEHDGRTAINTGEVVNRMVEKVEAYRQTNPETLLIVTADHETGGMTIEGKKAKSGKSGPDGEVPGYGKPQNVPLPKGQTPKRWGPFGVKGASGSFKVDWTTPGHTGTPVPITASGPGAHRLSGINDNTYVHEVALDVLSNPAP